jgi:fluoride exporter
MSGMLGSAWAPLWVFIGAGFGAVLRWALAVAWNESGASWPWGTLMANLLGGLLMGVAMQGLDERLWPALDPQLVRHARLLLVTGFLGGLTTFSTFSGEVIGMMQAQRWTEALLWAAAHLAGSLVLTGLGWALVRWAVAR